MLNNTIYIKAEKNCVVSNKKVLLEDVVKLYGTDKKAVKELGGTTALVVEGTNRCKYCFSILKIMELIHKSHPALQLQNIGETDFIVEYIPQGRKNKAAEYCKAVFVCITVFVGAAFTIMTFNQDVSVIEVFEMIKQLVTGQQDVGAGLLEIGYSVGLPLGVIVFFNHFARKKIDSDPTPLQVQLRVYEEDIEKTVIKNAERENRTIDAQ